jgi:Concanavalin A-like lectin/glucanases superfamily
MTIKMGRTTVRATSTSGLGTGPFAKEYAGAVLTPGVLSPTAVGDTFHSTDNKVYRCTSLSPVSFDVFTWSGVLSDSQIAIVNNGLVLYLDANIYASYPGSGITWYDLSGKGNDATLYGSPTWGSGSFSFPGNQSVYGSCNSFNSFPTGAAAFTLSVWAKNLNPYSNNAIFEYGNNAAAPSVVMGAGQGGSWYGRVRDSYGANQTLDNISSPVDVTKWHNGVLTYDGTTLKFYLDGVVKGTITTMTAAVPTVTTAAIARERYYDSLYGTVSSVALYDRALLAAEVLFNYNTLAPYNV